MKVLFLTNIPSPYRVKFFNELNKKCDVTVFFEGVAAKNRNKSWQKDNIFNFTPIFAKGIAVNKEQFFCPQVINILRKKWDKIVLCGFSSPTVMLAILYLKLFRKPFYIEIDGATVQPESKIKHWFKTKLNSCAIGWFSSGKMADDYFLNYGAKKENIYHYPFTSLIKADILNEPPTQEEKQKLRKELGIAEDEIILGVGSFIERKGFNFLIEAVKDLSKDIGVYLVGGKAPKEYLELQKKYNLTNLHFVDFQDKNSLSRFYKVADLFVLPTLKDSWGLVINEAMAYGLPVITTDKCSSAFELIKEGENGYIVKAKDISALRIAIEKVFAGDYKNMRSKSLEIIKKYNIENMALEHCKVWGIK